MGGRSSQRTTGSCVFKFLRRSVDKTLAYPCLIEANQTSIITCGRSVTLISVSNFLRDRGRGFHLGVFQLAVTFFGHSYIKPQDWFGDNRAL